ncbi:MAG: hypothetical protein J1G06_07970 [Oscillospiraceae bacterium]|nr:hypothetical protein [Oscillospiraceae bacterium]
MKKLVSILSSAAIFASLLAVPVSAEYIEAEYDVEIFNETFDDGNTEGMDGSPAKQLTAEERVMEIKETSAFTNGFYLSFDFRFDSDGGSVPGYFEIDKKKNNGDMDKLGPKFTLDNGSLKNQTGGSSYDTVGQLSPDTWYTAELEGTMVVAGAAVIMSVYDSDGNAVIDSKNISLRQFYGGSSNGLPDTLRGYMVSFDNIKMIAKYPDNITIETESDEITSGQSLPLSYSMTRLDAAIAKYDVEWSLYDEAGEAELVSEDVYISSENVLVTNRVDDDVTVTVRASATFGEKELVGTKQITIKGVSVGDELFDDVTISGPDSVKAGEKAEYTFTATKGGVDVTDSLADSDFTWAIYTADDMNPNNNSAMSISSGKTATLEIADGVIPQTINVRLSSASGFVFKSKPVAIEWSDSQKETVLAYNACETAIDTATRVESIDGSQAYQTTTNTYIGFGTRTDYVLTEFDIRFVNEGSAVYFERDTTGGGKWNTSFHFRGGDITTQSGGSNYPSLGLGIPVTSEDWLHFEVLYSPSNASCNVTKYNADGTLGDTIKKLNIERRNGEGYGCLNIWGGVIIDNIKISLPVANELTLTTPRESILAGEELQLTATISRNGLPINDASGLTWQLLDEEGLPIIDDDAPVKISDSGLLTTDPLADAQTVTVQVSTASSKQTVTIEIKTSEIFNITNIGINEEGTKIVKLYVDKNFNYFDEVTFIVAIHNAEGVLTGVAVRSMYGDALQLGSNELALDLELPADFNSDTDEVSVMAWTTF